MFQTLRVILTLGMFIPAMWLFMHLIRPYSDRLSDHLGWWTPVVFIVVPYGLYFILRRFERPADHPPSRLNWLLRRRY
ncbi:MULTISPECIES: hypothetical protein [unclassified Mesorhizobium]|uniref:hypothetical protein n=1 Tax=unclassified Mesorhizobium TaxID=325217 RepID=UPI000FCAA321|nr:MULTISPECIES: hypothetical protein [unclassified Mesorhizobium]RUV12404.1 hypothetical protein EOA91_28050 [Mesorhizobium sp. M1A.F.Ca.IN.022.04.1.1]RWG26251.1 MAG: hypothetical protein EOQ60_27815 [Mesorhizobium sp.]